MSHLLWSQNSFQKSLSLQLVEGEDRKDTSTSKGKERRRGTSIPPSSSQQRSENVPKQRNQEVKGKGSTKGAFEWGKQFSGKGKGKFP